MQNQTKEEKEKFKKNAKCIHQSQTKIYECFALPVSKLIQLLLKFP
jgi:hypothetical protein